MLKHWYGIRTISRSDVRTINGYMNPYFMAGEKEQGITLLTTGRITVFEDGKKELKKLSKNELQSLLEKVFSLKNTVLHDNKPVKSPDHPTMKPVTLCARLIYNSSHEGDIVYEPFGGSGSTLIAAEQLNRKCCLIEIDPKYCDIIVRRYKELKPNADIKHIRNVKK